ncbi:hypothetical protein, variant [Verruconis gallopava]|uniref:Uncharacterized protein n=1 Tax=Verruconis gallopava TaxID=253628 RepID=A0A0D1X8L1_9PEZI|nr:hypothetical protein, variant [Verruconis gallopava]KIV98350.1 hypothetical protein, variant [Verruconis gallopava]
MHSNLFDNEEETNALGKYSWTRVLHKKGHDDDDESETPPHYFSTPPENLPNNYNIPAKKNINLGEILFLTNKEKAQYASLHRGKGAHEDTLLQITAQLGFQTFASMTLYYLARASAHNFHLCHTEFCRFVKNSFLTLDPNVVIALSGMTCAVVGIQGRELTNSNIFAYLRQLEADLYDLLEWGCQPEAVTVSEASSSFQVIQIMLSQGPSRKFLKYQGNLKKDLEVGLSTSWDVATKLRT